jgi:hypothetical protein
VPDGLAWLPSGAQHHGQTRKPGWHQARTSGTNFTCVLTLLLPQDLSPQVQLHHINRTEVTSHLHSKQVPTQTQCKSLSGLDCLVILAAVISSCNCCSLSVMLSLTHMSAHTPNLQVTVVALGHPLGRQYAVEDHWHTGNNLGSCCPPNACICAHGCIPYVAQ